jgi:WD40 repeat protein
MARSCSFKLICSPPRWDTALSSTPYFLLNSRFWPPVASRDRLWDMKGAGGGRSLGRHTSSINQLRFSPDGRWLARQRRRTSVWEVATAQQTFVLEGDVYAVSGVDFTPAGDVVTANWDGTAHLWRLPVEGR